VFKKVAKDITTDDYIQQLYTVGFVLVATNTNLPLMA
jgi:hypothetical protein